MLDTTSFSDMWCALIPVRTVLWLSSKGSTCTCIPQPVRLFWMLFSFFWMITRRLTFRNTVPSSWAVYAGRKPVSQLFFLLTPSMKMEQSVPKRRHIKFRRLNNHPPPPQPQKRIQYSEQGESLKSGLVWIYTYLPHTNNMHLLGNIHTTLLCIILPTSWFGCERATVREMQFKGLSTVRERTCSLHSSTSVSVLC